MNPIRLLFGTLTVFRVRPPGVVDRRVAGQAMLLAPLAGFVLATCVVVPWWLLLRLADALGLSAPGPLVSAAMVTGALALLTRGMHLDGLADVADGLGSGRRGAEAVAIMRKSDIGPFGVVTMLLVVLVQVGALAEHIASGTGPFVVLWALVLSRLVLPVLCTPLFPAASDTGLGRTMAGSLALPRVVVAAALAGVLLLAGAGLLFGVAGTDDVFLLRTDQNLLGLAVLGVLGLVPALLLALRARSRFGGVTGDVYGAAVEAAYAGVLVLTLFA